MWTVSALQQHPRTIMVCDEPATLELRVKTVKYFKSLWEVHQDLTKEDDTASTVYNEYQIERKISQSQE